MHKLSQNLTYPKAKTTKNKKSTSSQARCRRETARGFLPPFFRAGKLAPARDSFLSSRDWFVVVF